MIEITNNIKLSKLLLESGSLLKIIYSEFEGEFFNFSFKDDIIFEFETKNFYDLFKKNFFTLLMLSIFLQAKIPKSRIISYGKIIIALRQIITSTDNIIDNEDKGVVKLKNLSNTVVKNSFISLLCQDILTHETLKLSSGDTKLSKKILEEIYSIAFSESLRDFNLYKSYPSTDFILSNIHSGIGGKLLEIALIAPCYLEKNSNIEKFKEGLYEIGMSLQAIDDLFDVDEDIKANKINLAVSAFLKTTTDARELRFFMLPEDFISEFLKNSLTSAYNGFSILNSSGFPINLSDSKFLLKRLFKLRGLEQYQHIIQ